MATVPGWITTITNHPGFLEAFHQVLQEKAAIEADKNDTIDDVSDQEEQDYYGNHPDDLDEAPAFSLAHEEAFVFPAIEGATQ